MRNYTIKMMPVWTDKNDYLRIHFGIQGNYKLIHFRSIHMHSNSIETMVDEAHTICTFI